MTEPEPVSTEDVRTDYCAAWNDDADLDRERWTEKEREFDQWLASVKAGAWDEGATARDEDRRIRDYMLDETLARNPYRLESEHD